MHSRSARVSLGCTQCGAELDPGEGDVFVTCAHCDSSLYLDRGEVVFHYILTRTLDARQAKDILKRWMSGTRTAKNLDRLAEIEEPELHYVPIWRFRALDDSGEQVYLEAAAAETLPVLQGLTIPPGEARIVHGSDLVPLLDQPTIPHETAFERLWTSKTEAPRLREVALVHVPVFFLRYRHHGQTYQAAVEAASGEVFTGAYPTRQDLAYRVLGISTFALLLLAAFSLYWLLYVAGAELVPALALRCGLQLLIALPLLFVAWLVASKV
jgi:hypothetical protein